MADSYYGKYRGLVTDNRDPQNRGRVRAKVPDVLGTQDSGWALPCLPFGGEKMGFFSVPEINSSVWIEFEQGDPDYPIWCGCWWEDSGRAPSGAEPGVLIISKGGHSILIDDSADTGGITIKVSSGAKIVMNDQGIKFDNGKGDVFVIGNRRLSNKRNLLEI